MTTKKSISTQTEDMREYILLLFSKNIRETSADVLKYLSRQDIKKAALWKRIFDPVAAAALYGKKRLRHSAISTTDPQAQAVFIVLVLCENTYRLPRRTLASLCTYKILNSKIVSCFININNILNWKGMISDAVWHFYICNASLNSTLQ